MLSSTSQASTVAQVTGWRAGLAIAAVIAMLAFPGRLSAEDEEQVLLINALQKLQIQVFSLRTWAEAADLTSRWERAVSDTKYLHETASRWKPSRKGDGRDFREAIQLLSTTLGRTFRAPAVARPIHPVPPQYSQLLFTAFEDIHEKAVACMHLGLIAKPSVIVRTKGGGLQEVGGLEVWYLEKFVAVVNPNAAPHRFDRFSSPVTGELVPGRYLFWASDPKTSRAGKKVEECVCDPSLAGPPPYKFEILAP